MIDGTASAMTLGGGLAVVNGASLTLVGSIDNGGAVYLNGTSAATSLVIAAAGAALTGGKVAMGASSQNLIVGAGASAMLTNASLIFGAGDIGDGSMSLDNAAGGEIDASTAVALTIDTGTNSILNAGVIKSMGAGGAMIASAIDNTGSLIVNGGDLTVDGAVTGSGRAYLSGGTMTFDSSFTQNVIFDGKNGVLALAQSRGYAGTIAGFSKTGGTSLDLEDIGFTQGVTTASYAGTTAGGVLTVTNGEETATIHLAGNYTASTWTVSSDGHGGTTVVDSATASPARFIHAAAALGAAGAALASDNGHAWQERLAILAAPGRTPLA
jgi:hypothetical protein